MSTNLMREAERSAALRRRSAQPGVDSAEPTGEHAPHPLVALQRQIGNAGVERMLAQREGEEEEVQAKHDPIQRAEEEEEVQAKHDPIQREGEEDEMQAKHDLAQAQPEVGLAGGPISSDLSGRINSRRGAGSSLDSGTRASMEQSFGTSFGDVRVHTDSESDSLNRSISAKAFTTGSDIFFRKDSSPSDHGLLAHELTHVVQQRGMSGGGGAMSVGAAGDTHEQEADQVSSAVTSGTAAQAQREYEQAQIARATAIQREGEEEEEMG